MILLSRKEKKKKSSFRTTLDVHQARVAGSTSEMEKLEPFFSSLLLYLTSNPLEASKGLLPARTLSPHPWPSLQRTPSICIRAGRPFSLDHARPPSFTAALLEEESPEAASKTITAHHRFLFALPSTYMQHYKAPLKNTSISGNDYNGGFSSHFSLF